MPSRERQTADAIVDAFNALDPHTIVSHRAPNCLRVILPTSLNFPSQTNAEYLANLLSMNSIFTSFKLSVNDVIEGKSTSADGTETTKIVMYVTAFGETPVGDYNNEYVWTMGFEDVDGTTKVSEWSEFVDVGMARDFLPKLRGELMRRRAEALSKSKEDVETNGVTS